MTHAEKFLDSMECMVESPTYGYSSAPVRSIECIRYDVATGDESPQIYLKIHFLDGSKLSLHNFDAMH